MTLLPNKASVPQDSQFNVLDQERNFAIVESISLHYVMLQLTVKISRLTLEFALITVVTAFNLFVPVVKSKKQFVRQALIVKTIKLKSDNVLMNAHPNHCQIVSVGK